MTKTLSDDSGRTPEPAKRPRLWLATASGVLLFLATQYAISIWNLLHSAEEMQNKFSTLAQTEYRSFLIGENLRVLIAYAILLVVGTLLVLPVVGFVFRRRPRPNRWLVAGTAVVVTMLVHAFFLMRLAHTRPYFVAAGSFGHWLDALPAAVRPATDAALFVVLPWAFLGLVIFWWCRRIGTKGSVALLLPVVLAGALFTFNREAQRPQKKAVAAGQPMNVIIIGSDSLRGDRVGYSGYRPLRTTGAAAAAGVSPQIDAWSQDAVRFDRCYTPVASTLESGVSVMSSTYPHTHGFRQMYPDKKQVEETSKVIHPIATELEKKGYDTAAMGDWCAGYYQMMPLGFKDISVSTFDNFKVYMSQAVILAHFVVPLYFDNDLGFWIFPQMGSFAQFVNPEIVTQRVEEKLAKQATTGRPFFWHVHYSCNHYPYHTQEPYCRMFTDPAYAGIHKTGMALDMAKWIGGSGLDDDLGKLPQADVDQIRALYDGCTRNFDDCVGRILGALKKEGLADHTIVIVTADHGEDLFEPGVVFGHGLGFNGSDPCYRIPLAIHVPGVKGGEIPEQVRTIDISPTILDLLGVERPAAWEGRSVAPWIRGEAQPEDLPFYGETSLPWIQFKVPGVERPPLPPMDGMSYVDRDFNYQFVLQKGFPERVLAAKQRCLRTRDWKIVCTPASDGSRHFGLFHTATDPDSRQDLAAQRPEVLTVMKAALEKWMDQHQETPIREIFGGDEPG
jgi:arylsulfatase A-like enzyme